MTNLNSRILLQDFYLKAGEKQFLLDVLTKYYPTGIVSSVFDSYDYWAALTEILPEIKVVIMSRDGKLVVRPDSGDPIEVVCGTVEVWDGNNFDSVEDAANFFTEKFAEEIREKTPHGELGDDEATGYFSFEDVVYAFDVSIDCNRYDKQFYFIENYSAENIRAVELTPQQKGTIQVLWETFGGKVNSKGYKVLDEHIGLIYGDGINYYRAKEIFTRLKQKGFASSNIVYGVGSYTLHLVSRDDLGFAIKATHCRVGNRNVPIYKDPKTDSGKKSAKGYLYVSKNDNSDYILESDVSFEKHMSEDNLLRTIFKDNEFFNEVSIDDIRRNLGVPTSL